jgi:hypothetical protein
MKCQVNCQNPHLLKLPGASNAGLPKNSTKLKNNAGKPQNDTKKKRKQPSNSATSPKNSATSSLKSTQVTTDIDTKFFHLSLTPDKPLIKKIDMKESMLLDDTLRSKLYSLEEEDTVQSSNIHNSNINRKRLNKSL